MHLLMQLCRVSRLYYNNYCQISQRTEFQKSEEQNSLAFCLPIILVTLDKIIPDE